MQRLGPLHRFRLTLVVKMAATCLIVLTILPFTAPFSTFDLAEVTESAAHHGGSSPAKESKDSGPALIVTLTIVHLAPIAVTCIAAAPARTSLFVPAFVVIRV